jgi:hypothetical protein
MSKKGKRARTHSTLKEHQRHGSTLTPPLAAIKGMRPYNWARDALPDLLWLCCVISGDRLRGLRVLCDAIDCIDEVLDRERDSGVILRPEDLIVDGTLTSLEAVPSELRAEAIDLMESRGVYDQAVPESFAHSLGMYPDAPGSWLIDRWKTDEWHIDWEVARNFLSGVISSSADGQSELATDAKFVAIRGRFKAGKISIQPKSDIPYLLSRYPVQLTEEELRKARPTIRSLWGGLYFATNREAEGEPASLLWSRKFWRSNWQKYPCIMPDDNGAHHASEADLRDRPFLPI